MKTRHIHALRALVSTMAAITLFLSASAISVQAACLSLSVDLKSGMSDTAATGGSIRQMQAYLVQAGYLKATPNGYFGAGTLAAVKAFQAANSISVTGTVGPLTRAALQKKSCVAAAAAGTGSTETVISNPANAQVAAAVTANPTAAPSASQPNIISPKTGDVLTIGTTQLIAWTNPTGSVYDLVLERTDRAGGGYIVTGVSGSNPYSWRAGKVIVSSSEREQTTATGTYRIRVQRTSGATDNDPTSGWFTLSAPPLTIGSILPAAAVADDNAAVVLYGSGFVPGSQVYFDVLYGTSARILYISDDGTTIVFAVPTSVASGAHTVLVSNSGAVSNSVNLRVSNPKK